MQTVGLSLFWQGKHPQRTSHIQGLEETMMTFHNETNSHLKTKNRHIPWCFNYRVSVNILLMS